MMRDGDRIDHVLSFTRRCIEVLEGVDKAQFLDSVDKQESLELNFLVARHIELKLSQCLRAGDIRFPSWERMVWRCIQIKDC